MASIHPEASDEASCKQTGSHWCKSRPALGGGMDWWRGVWNCHFPESEKYLSEAEFSRKMPQISQKERFSPNFRLRNLKIQRPIKRNSIPQPFHTPTRLPHKKGSEGIGAACLQSKVGTKKDDLLRCECTCEKCPTIQTGFLKTLDLCVNCGVEMKLSGQHSHD